MIRSVLPVLAVVLLAACDDGSPNNNVRNIKVPEGEYQARLLAMSEGERNAVFIRAIRDAGRNCQGVRQSAFEGDEVGRPVWSARCSDGSLWMIVIGRAGIAQVASYDELRAAKDRQGGTQP